MANNDSNNRYNQRGVSSSKEEVHQVVDKLDRGCFPGAFCKVTDDSLTGDENLCNVIHSDGAGTKIVKKDLKVKVIFGHYKVLLIGQIKK